MIIGECGYRGNLLADLLCASFYLLLHAELELFTVVFAPLHP